MTSKLTPIIPILLFGLGQSMFGQIPQVGFGLAFGGSGQNTGYDVCTTPSGESIVVGSYSTALTLGSSTLPNLGNTDGLIVKVGANGNYLWAKSLSGSGDDLISHTKIDEQGNIYVAGEHSQTASFDGTQNVNNAGKNAFIAKINGNGNLVWQRSIGNDLEVDFNDVAVDGSGNLYGFGEFAGTLNLDGITLTSTGTRNIFVVKFDSSGVAQWAKKMGRQFDNGLRIWVNTVGECSIAGDFLGQIIIGTDTLKSKGLSDAFVARLDLQGNPLWAKSFGGTQTDNCLAITGDAANNIYVSAVFFETVNLGTSTLTSHGKWDILVAKFSDQGTNLWATSFGGSDNDRSNDVELDPQGNLLVTGWYQDTMRVGSSDLISLGGHDVFVATFNSSGVPQNAYSFGGSSIDVGAGIGLDGAGNTYLTGYYFSNDFTVGNLTLPTSSGTRIFVIKLGNQPTSVWKKNEADHPLAHYSLPDHLVFETKTNGYLQLINLKGQVLFQGPIKQNQPFLFPGKREILVFRFVSELDGIQKGMIPGF